MLVLINDLKAANKLRKRGRHNSRQYLALLRDHFATSDQRRNDLLRLLVKAIEASCGTNGLDIDTLPKARLLT